MPKKPLPDRIRRRKDGSYEYRERINGKRVSIYGMTIGEVRRKVLDEIARGGGEIRPRVPISVAQLFEAHLESIKRRRAASTYAQYETEWRVHIKPTLGNKRIGRITADDIAGLYESLEAKGVGSATIARVHQQLRQVFRVAAGRDYITINPLDAVEAPHHKSEEKRPLDKKELAVFLDAIRGNRYEALYMLAAIGGMRQGELFALYWTDIDFKARHVRIQRSLQDARGKLTMSKPKTKSSIRTLDIDGETIAALQARRKAWQREPHMSELVFTGPDGGWLRKSNFIRREFEPLLQRIRKCKKKECENLWIETLNGVVCPKCGSHRTEPALTRLKFHDLRHTAATMMLLAGLHPKIVSDRLGHSSIKTTLDLYSHLIDGMGSAAADQLGDFILAVRTEEMSN